MVVTLKLPELPKKAGFQKEPHYNNYTMKKTKKTDKLNQTKPKGILHGECIIFESSIPSDATPEMLTGEFTIIAPSETTGNHHVVDLHPGVEFFNKGGTRYF